VGDADGGIADEGGGGEQGQPGEEQLLRVCDVVVGRLLHKVAGGIRGGQRLPAGAGGGGFGDISIRIRGRNAAEGEGDQKEDEQEDGVRVLQDDQGRAKGAGVVPRLVVVEVRHAGAPRARRVRVRGLAGRMVGRPRARGRGS
jgi:hypothetical protein